MTGGSPATRAGRAAARRAAASPRPIASLAAAALAVLAGCAPASGPGAWADLTEVTPAFLAARGARHLALAADAHGRVALTFVTRDSTGATDLWIAVSEDSGTRWRAPRRLNAREGAVSSYPGNRPVAAFGADGRLAVAWSERRGDDPMAADLVVRASGDGGLGFGPAVVVNDDAAERPCYHGFAALAFLDDGSLWVAWMDEREVAAAAARDAATRPAGTHAEPGTNAPAHAHEEPGSASLFHARSSDGGLSFEPNRPLSDRMCPCCRPAVATPGGAVALAYRAAGGDLRDPALAVSTDGARTFPLDTVIAADGWRLPGCPSIGPALAATSEHGGLYAWYTGAGEPGVWVAPWRTDRGLAGTRRAMRDSLHDASHPRLAALEGSTLLAVEARPAADTTLAVLAVRALEPSGAVTPWVFLGARAEAGWLAATGPRSALAAWTERGPDGGRARLVRIARR